MTTASTLASQVRLGVETCLVIRGVTDEFPFYQTQFPTPNRTWLMSVEAAVIHLLCGVPGLRDELLEFEHQDIHKS